MWCNVEIFIIYYLYKRLTEQKSEEKRKGDKEPKN